MHCKNASHHSAYQSNLQASEIYYNETAKFTVTGVVFMRVDIVLKVYFFFLLLIYLMLHRLFGSTFKFSELT